MSIVSAGKYTQYVEILAAVGLAGSTGEVKAASWAVVCQTWATPPFPLSGGEGYAAGAAVASGLFRITIRNPAGVTVKATHRVRVNGTDVYEINNVSDPDGRGVDLILACSRAL